MADYSTIKGFTVQSLSSDPYATGAASGAWSSGGALNTGRTLWSAGTGTQYGKSYWLEVMSAPYSAVDNSETYNGTYMD